MTASLLFLGRSHHLQFEDFSSYESLVEETQSHYRQDRVLVAFQV